MARRTRLMQAVEKRYNRPLERLLPEMVNEKGLSATAEELGVSKATVGYWLLKLGITVRRVALAPGESLEVKRSAIEKLAYPGLDGGDGGGEVT